MANPVGCDCADIAALCNLLIEGMHFVKAGDAMSRDTFDIWMEGVLPALKPFPAKTAAGESLSRKAERAIASSAPVVDRTRGVTVLLREAINRMSQT
jgi:hypothetical protein